MPSQATLRMGLLPGIQGDRCTVTADSELVHSQVTHLLKSARVGAAVLGHGSFPCGLRCISAPRCDGLRSATQALRLSPLGVCF